MVLEIYIGNILTYFYLEQYIEIRRHYLAGYTGTYIILRIRIYKYKLPHPWEGNAHIQYLRSITLK